MELKGTPFQIGKKIGLHSKSIISRRIRQINEIERIKKIPPRIVNARIRDFTSLIGRVSPHWLEEMKGESVAAGVDTGRLIFLNCLPDGFYSELPPGFFIDTYQNCSSFVDVGSEKNILFKIRDEKNFPQSFSVLQNSGFLSAHAGRDIGNIGFAHFFNEKALAGANNTGSFTKHATDKPLFNDCHVMRYIAERAVSIKDIPSLVERLLEQKALGGANGERGALFLFADCEGGLLVECDSRDYAARFISKGRRVISNHYVTAKAKKWESAAPNRNTLARRERLGYLLSRNAGNLSPESLFRFSRDKKNEPDSLCRDNMDNIMITVSVQCQVISREKPSDSLNYICCGNPLHSVFIPVPVTHVRTYIPMLDGSFWKSSRKECGGKLCWKEFSAEMEKFEKRAVQSENISCLFDEAYGLFKKAA